MGKSREKRESRKRFRIVSSTAGTDPGRNFVGGPAGDLGNVGLIIPTDPTLNQYNRYYVRLAAFMVSSRMRARITSIRQLLTIASKVPVFTQEPVRGDGDPEQTTQRGPCDQAPAVLIEKEVRSPHWSFPDGNVQWFLRMCPIRSEAGTLPSVYLPGWDRDPFGLAPSILYLHTVVPGVPGLYVPPGNGVPVGDPIDIYGTMRSIEFPWRTHTSNQNAINLEVDGPCIVGLYASIWQTDPATRPVPNLGPGAMQFTTEAGLEDEDKFWIAFPCARYHRIAGELTAELRELPSRRKKKLPGCENPNASCRPSAPGDEKYLGCMKGEEP